MITTFLNYKIWANKKTFNDLLNLPEEELIKKRQTNFGNIIHTMNHIYVVDDIFKSHLLNQPHPYTARNTEDSPSLSDLWEKQQKMDQWYLDHAISLGEADLEKVVDFKFVDGALGKMTIGEIFLHIVNHGTYHRGFVSDMMYQIPAKPTSNDFTVYLQSR